MSKLHWIKDHIIRLELMAAYDRTLCDLEVDRAKNQGVKTEDQVTCKNCEKLLDKQRMNGVQKFSRK